MLMSAFGPKRTWRKTQSMSLLGVKRTCLFALQMSASDPKRTLTRRPTEIRCAWPPPRSDDMKIIILAALGLVCAAAPAQAQKYETNIPPVIVAPDSVDTRLGVLKFKVGVPDDATVQKVYDNLDFQRGVQAFLTAMPAASLVAIR